MSNTVGALERLREELKKTLEEKRRIDQKIADLKKTLAEAIGELKELGESVQVSFPTRGSARYINGNPVREEWSVETGPIKQFFWNWVVPFAVIVASLWVLFAFLGSQKEPPKVSSLTLPSLMATAEACSLSGRLQERREARLEQSEPIVPSEPPPVNVALETLSQSGSPDRDEVSRAVMALTRELSLFNTAYFQSAEGGEVPDFEKVFERLHVLIGLFYGAHATVVLSSPVIDADEETVSEEKEASSEVQSAPVRQSWRPLINLRNRGR